MKKSLVLFLGLLMLFLLISCSDNTKNDESLYNPIINHYKNLITAKNNSEELTASDELSDEINNALIYIADICKEPLSMGYATKDINSDGIPELVLISKKSYCYALFTIKDNSPILLMTLENDSLKAISNDGTIYATHSVKNESELTQVKKIVDGKLIGLEYGAQINKDTVSYYKIENDTRSEITSQEKNLLDENIRSIILTPTYYTKTTGFRFVPAITDNTSANTAPTADFTSYDGILSAYTKIVESFSEYTQSKWINGDFDGLFNISDNESYEVFHSIFYGGISNMPTKTRFGFEYDENGNNAYGYAKKDLNGDGTEELILLTDTYDIIALFTVKNGKAILLKEAASSWIDENGMIRIEKGTGGIVHRDGEGFVYEIKDAKLNCLVGVGFKVNEYLEKENWYKIEGNSKKDITKEEGEELYSKYYTLPTGYSYAEYTKTFAGLEFVHLFKATTASENHINTFSNGFFINGDTLTISSILDEKVSFTFKNVYTEGEFDPVTNPDPAVHTTTITGVATLNGNKYIFEQDGIKGYIEFTVNYAWLVVSESQNEYVRCKAYLFNSPEK